MSDELSAASSNTDPESRPSQPPGPGKRVGPGKIDGPEREDGPEKTTRSEGKGAERKNRPEKKNRSEKTLGWRIIASLVIPLLLILGRYRVRNAERIPQTGAFILVPNHYSNFDPLITGYTLWKHGRAPHFLAKSGLFRIPVIGSLLRLIGQIPVERAATGPHSDPLAAAARLGGEGLAIIIYPEGTFTRDPQMWPMRGKFGAVRLALDNNIPIIPCAHWGAQAVLPRYSKRLSLVPRKSIDIAIGEPFDLSPWSDKPRTRATYQEATTALMNTVTALLEELRQEKAPAVRWDPAEHGQTEIGRF